MAASDGAGVILSSSDAEELIAMCHRVVVMRRGRIATVLEGADVTERNISSFSLGSRTNAA
jgi:ABC-type sugar transport system ATPase subunit